MVVLLSSHRLFASALGTQYWYEVWVCLEDKPADAAFVIHLGLVDLVTHNILKGLIV